MVYLGGGSGMAPLRSYLSHLFETERTARRVSYWYGARSRQEMFYQDYFEELARKNANFTFHVALSQPRPEDQWTSHTGFIHEVLKRQYPDSHPDPTRIEYYLCGPLAMVRAAIKMLTELGVSREQIAGDEFCSARQMSDDKSQLTWTGALPARSPPCSSPPWRPFIG